MFHVIYRGSEQEKQQLLPPQQILQQISKEKYDEFLLWEASKQKQKSDKEIILVQDRSGEIKPDQPKRDTSGYWKGGLIIMFLLIALFVLIKFF